MALHTGSRGPGGPQKFLEAPERPWRQPGGVQGPPRALPRRPGGVWFVRGGAPPDTCPGGVALSGGCPGGVRGVSGGHPPPDVRGAPPDNPPDTCPGGPPGHPPDIGHPPRTRHTWIFAAVPAEAPVVFSSTVSIFEAFCVARACMLLGQIGADFHTSRDRFQLFAPLCSSRNPERVIRCEPLLYSKITIRVLRTATTVPIRTLPMAAKS